MRSLVGRVLGGVGLLLGCIPVSCISIGCDQAWLANRVVVTISVSSWSAYINDKSGSDDMSASSAHTPFSTTDYDCCKSGCVSEEETGGATSSSTLGASVGF